MVACCHKFFVSIEHLTIMPKRAKVNLIICSDVEIGISVTLIDRSGSNLNGVGATRGLNETVSISGNLAASAQSASSRVVNPKRIIFNVLFNGSCFTDAPMNEGYSAPLNNSQALLVFSRKDLLGRKVSAAQ